MNGDPNATNDVQPAGVSETGEDPTVLPDAYVIPRALAQATLEYLASQPYREVFTLVKGFEALEPLASRDAEPPTRR